MKPGAKLATCHAWHRQLGRPVSTTTDFSNTVQTAWPTGSFVHTESRRKERSLLLPDDCRLCRSRPRTFTRHQRQSFLAFEGVECLESLSPAHKCGDVKSPPLVMLSGPRHRIFRLEQAGEQGWFLMMLIPPTLSGDGSCFYSSSSGLYEDTRILSSIDVSEGLNLKQVPRN